MESLRAQLAETQGALTERDKKFRQLRADHVQATKSWAEEKSVLEAKIARLELESLRLQWAPPNIAGKPGQPTAPIHRKTKETPEMIPTRKGSENRPTSKDNQGVDGDDTMTITRSRMKQAEAQFENIANKLAEKAKMCEVLQAKLAQSRPTFILELSDDQVVTRWNQLRDQIRKLSLERLNKTVPTKLMSDKCKDEFKLLSPHWKTYTSTPDMTCYLFRALIWRYLLRYFEIPCRACGRGVSKKVAEMAAMLSTKLQDADYQDWRIHTATLVHKIYPIDKSLIDEVAAKILEAIAPLVADTDSTTLIGALRDIAEMTAELSAIFDRSRFVVLMYNEPGSTLTHGFPYVEDVMDMRGKLGAQGVVDLMITPSLLKKEAEYSVLVKAEVVC
ncbi:hypothetical protein HD806DRAFT_516473 [Xylariaceae sp. AK1471]|nr:hypothetical protein HD806DRAFT_516473 [Xylariaceae sp. AK1471]